MENANNSVRAGLSARNTRNNVAHAGARKNKLQDWVDEELTRRFQGRILDVDADTAAQWGRLKARADARGQPVPVIDSLIAATALVHNLVVVTRNVKDFDRCGVSVHNPWT